MLEPLKTAPDELPVISQTPLEQETEVEEQELTIPTPSKRKNIIVSCALTPEQSDAFNKVLDYRLKQGFCVNKNEMLIQCIFFTLNHKEGWEFSKPEDYTFKSFNLK